MRRRKAREYALQFLYSIDFTDTDEQKTAQKQYSVPTSTDLDLFWSETKEVGKETRVFADELIVGTIENLKEIDAIISATASKWHFSRIAAIDKNILRFAVFELLKRSDIPFAVTINEALEISKKFSTLQSSSFINGILDKIAQDFGKK